MSEEKDEAQAGEQPVKRFHESCRLIYAAYLFGVTIPETPAGPATIPVMSIYNDPFLDELWIGRAHIEGERTLAQRLIEEKALDVWMLPRGKGKARRVSVQFDGLRALPLDLNSCIDAVALEWVVLKSVRCAQPVDVEFEEIPEVFHNQPAALKL